VPATLSDVRIERGRDSFVITYLAEHRRGAIDLAWRAEIRGESSGTIRFGIEGEARSTFLRNRIGLCVHHPIAECAGLPCRVELVDGTTREGAFPLGIAPHQPFRDLRAISHEVIPGLRAEVRFAGEVFEMEDQRNWTDASFKTYGTPLDLPFPVEVPRGARVVQSVTLDLSGVRPITEPAVASPRTIEASLEVGNGPALPLPDLGLGMASHGQPLRPTEVARLRALRLSHLRLDLVLSRSDTAETLRRAAHDAAGVGVPLEIALFLSEAAEEELNSLWLTLDETRPDVRTWWVFHVSEKSTTERLARLARESLRSYNPAAKFGGGTNAYFAELNRARPPIPPPISALDLVGYSLNPQVHASDLSSLVENIEAQADTVTSARRLAGGLPVAVGPITFRPCFNPNATEPEPDPGPGELPTQVDPRQMSLFGAGWVVGSLRSLALAGASSLTYFETHGWRGVMETGEGSPLPARFRSLPGSVFPLYHVLADVGEFARGGVLPIASDDLAGLDGLALVHGDRLRVLLANHGPSPRRVRVANLRASARIRHLDASNAIEAMRSPDEFRARIDEPMETTRGVIELELQPFGVVRVDTE
jgi:hypothetical protein